MTTKKMDRKTQKIYDKGFASGVRACLEDNNDAIKIGRTVLEVVMKNVAKEISIVNGE